MKKIIFYISLFLVFVGVKSINADTLDFVVSTTHVNKEIYNGVQWISETGKSHSDQGYKNTQYTHLVKASLDNVKLVNWNYFNSSGTLTATSTLNLAKDFEAKNPGYKVIAGVNADYFTTGTTINANVGFGGDILKKMVMLMV